MLTRRTMITAAVVIGCSLGGLASAQPAQPTITLDANADGGTTTIAVGTMFAIALPENPSTGYTWKLQPLAIPVVGVIGDRYVAPAGEPQPGAGGTREITLVALAPGTAPLVLTLQRQWEENAPPTQTFRVTIAVASADNGGQ